MKLTFLAILLSLWATLPGLSQNISTKTVLECRADSIQVSQARASLTIEDVKSAVQFPSGSIAHTSLCGLCDCWYAIALQEGKTPEQAAWVAFDKLSKRVAAMTARILQKE